MRLSRIGNFLPGVLLSIALLTSTGAKALEDKTVIGPDARQALTLTVYQNGLAFVDEARTPDTKIKAHALILPAISPRAIPSSVTVDAPIPARSIHHALSPVSLELLLQAHEGEEIGIVRRHPTTGEEITQRARIISAPGGVVLEIDGRIVVGLPGQPVFDGLPDMLLHRPAVHVQLAEELSGRAPTLIHYLTDGLGWEADHVVTITETNGAAETMRLETRATLTNTTGLSYPKATLRLVAGSLNRESAPQPMMRTETMMMAAAPAAAMDMPVRETLGDYHLYRLPGVFDLGEGEPVQIPLSAERTVQGSRSYVLTGGPQPYFSQYGHGMKSSEHPAVIHSFENTGDDPLPAGIIRVYGKGGYMGEDRIPPTPKGGSVSLNIGQSFDTTVIRSQTGFRILGENSRTSESDHEITLENAADHDVTVEVRENVPGDWKLLSASHKMTRDGMAAVWQVPVPAGGQAVLWYAVRVKR